MNAYLINMHLLVPRSRSSAKIKVKYNGYISQKNGRFGGIRVSQTHPVGIVLLYILVHSCVKYLSKICLTLSETTNFRLFQTQRVCKRQFQNW